MARYLLEIPHSPEECTAELDSVLGHSREMFGRFDWGCKEGTHVGWAILEAQDPPTLRSMLPMALRGRAKIVSVVKFTPEDVQAFHEDELKN